MKRKLNEWFISVVRTTIAPFIGAWIIAFLMKHGIDYKPTATFWTALNFVIMGVYYVVFRGIEILAKNPKIQKIAGIFLGYPRVEVPKP